MVLGDFLSFLPDVPAPGRNEAQAVVMDLLMGSRLSFRQPSFKAMRLVFSWAHIGFSDTKTSGKILLNVFQSSTLLLIFDS